MERAHKLFMPLMLLTRCMQQVTIVCKISVLCGCDFKLLYRNYLSKNVENERFQWMKFHDSCDSYFFPRLQHIRVIQPSGDFPGGRIASEAPLHVSNVALVDPADE